MCADRLGSFQVDWNLPIDYTDKYGNTLLHIAVQNGSKRIAKLLLRRGEWVRTRRSGPRLTASGDLPGSRCA